MDPVENDDEVIRLRFAMDELRRASSLDEEKPMRTIRYNLYMSLHGELMARKQELHELKWAALGRE